MTSQIFTKWVMRLVKKFFAEKRKVSILLGNVDSKSNAKFSRHTKPFYSNCFIFYYNISVAACGRQLCCPPEDDRLKGDNTGVFPSQHDVRSTAVWPVDNLKL